MPIHYTIIYDPDESQANSCAEGQSVETELFQHAIVKHDGSYVEQIVVTYSADPTTGAFPTEAFELIMRDLSYSVEPIRRTVQTTDNGSRHDPTSDSAKDCYIVTFSAPTQTGDVLFEFGTSSTPPTKLKVKIKHKPGAFACP